MQTNLLLINDINTQLQDIQDAITEKEDVQLTCLALEAIANLQSMSCKEAKNLSHIHAIKEELVKYRILKLVKFIYPKDETIKEKLGISLDKKPTFVEAAKSQLEQTIVELKRISNDPSVQATWVKANVDKQNQIKNNRAALEEKSKTLNQITTLTSSDYIISKIHTENHLSFDLVGSIDLVEPSDSFMLKQNYLSREAIDQLQLQEFLFLESPTNQELIRRGLKNILQPLSIEEIRLFVKRSRLLCQNPKLLNLVLREKLSFEQFVNFKIHQLTQVCQLSVLLEANKISVEFIEQFPEIANLLITNISLFHLLLEEKIDTETLVRLSLPQLTLLGMFYDDLFLKQNFHFFSIEEIAETLTEFSNLTDFQKQQYTIDSFFSEYPEDSSLRPLINRMGPSSTCSNLIYLFKKEKMTLLQFLNLTVTDIERLNTLNIYTLILKGDLTLQQALDLTPRQVSMLTNSKFYYFYSNHLAPLDVLFKQPLRFYNLFSCKDLEFCHFYLSKGFATIEDLKDSQFVYEAFHGQIMELVERGYNLHEIRKLKKFELENLLIISDLKKEKSIKKEETEDLELYPHLMDRNVLRLVSHHFISLQTLKKLDEWFLQKLQNSDIVELVLSGHVTIDDIDKLDPTPYQNLINCKTLIEKERISIDQVDQLDLEITELLSHPNIIELIDQRYLDVNHLPPIEVLVFLTAPLMVELALKKKIALKELCLIISQPSAYLLSRNKNRVQLALENILTINQAIYHSHEAITRLSHPLVKILIKEKQISPDKVLELDKDHYNWLTKLEINILIYKNFLSFEQFSLLTNSAKNSLKNTTISLLIQEGYLKIEKALQLKPVEIKKLDSFEIRMLLSQKELTVEQCLKLPVKIENKLKIQGIDRLVRAEMISFEEVTNLTAKAQSILENENIYELIYRSVITLEQALGFNENMLENLENSHLFCLFKEKFLHLDHLRLCQVDKSYENLRVPHIAELIRNGKLDVNKALSLSRQQIQYLSRFAIKNTILDEDVSVDKQLLALR